ncbi:MAG: hypothetical protein V4857_01415 [Pseudomonadota bacterium]
MSTKFVRRFLCALALALGLAQLGAAAKPAPLAVPETVPAAAQAVEPAKPSGAASLRTGAYITSLYDLNANNNTFTADLWLWFLHDKAFNLKPLKTLETANARDFRPGVDTVEEHGTERYHAQKVRGVFNHNWDVRNFPFDRHELQIRLEEGLADIHKIRFVADQANTGFDPQISIEGWNVTKVSIETGEHVYNSSFGLKNVAGSRYAASTISIFVERDGLALFFKLLSAVYIAFMVSIVSFFLDPSKDGLFNGRVSLSVGMIFAVIINSQRVAGTLGQTPVFTLADKIHILTLVAIVFSLLGALVSRRLHMQGRGDYADSIDRRMAVGMVAVFTAANLLMILAAAKGG